MKNLFGDLALDTSVKEAKTAVDSHLGTDGTTPPVILGAGTGVRGWLRSIYEKLTGTITVAGTFWQSTQPVSGTVTVFNPTNNPETGLAKEATLALIKNTDGIKKITDAVTIANPTANPETGLAKEITLAKLVGFNINSNITTTDITVGNTQTISQTDGVKTLTYTINLTTGGVTKVWSV